MRLWSIGRLHPAHQVNQRAVAVTQNVGIDLARVAYLFDPPVSRIEEVSATTDKTKVRQTTFLCHIGL